MPKIKTKTKAKSSRTSKTARSSRSSKARQSPRRSTSKAPKSATTSKRAVWKGAITFGLITIPVGLYTAVEERDISFHQLTNDGARIKYKRVSAKTGREVPYEDILRGYEYEKDKYVVFTDEELDRIPSESYKAIDVVNFLDRAEIDPLFFQQGYYVAPEPAGLKAYSLLVKALEKSGKVGLAKVTLREKERLATIRPKDDVLVLETMNWPDEIRIPKFEVLEKRVQVRPQELEMAESLVRNLSEEFRPEEFVDSYRQRLEEAIDAKIAGKEVQLAPDEPEREEVTDLMEALRASVEASKSKRRSA